MIIVLTTVYAKEIVVRPSDSSKYFSVGSWYTVPFVLIGISAIIGDRIFTYISHNLLLVICNQSCIYGFNDIL